MEARIKGTLWGVSVVIVAILINWTILSLLDFPIMATNIIIQYWYLLVLLIGGFGLQVGMFVYYNSLNAISRGTTIASGGISAFGMVLCCSHYLLTFLPFLGAVVGISFFAVLANYTMYFLILGVVSNAIGISVIYYQRKKYCREKLL